MMKKIQLMVLLCTSFLWQPGHAAAVVTNVTANGNSFNDFGVSSAGTFSPLINFGTGVNAGTLVNYISVDYLNSQSVKVDFSNTDGMGSDLFLVDLFNHSGADWQTFTFQLVGASMSGPYNFTLQSGTLVAADSILDPLTFDQTGVTLSFSPFESFSLTDVTGSVQSMGSYSLIMTPNAVPVPAAVWLFGSGLLGLVGVARRKSANP